VKFYLTDFVVVALVGSMQFVIPPVRSTKWVIVNCGAQSTSRPLKLPVTVADWKPAKDPSSRWTPDPPLPERLSPAYPRRKAVRLRTHVLMNLYLRWPQCGFESQSLGRKDRFSRQKLATTCAKQCAREGGFVKKHEFEDYLFDVQLG